VIVHDLDIDGAVIAPTKAHPELVVDAYAVLTRPYATQRLQAISRWRAQELKRLRRIQLRQLALCHMGNAREPTRLAGLKQALSVFAPKAPDHLATL
jgi:hypothetical protein